MPLNLYQRVYKPAYQWVLEQHYAGTTPEQHKWNLAMLKAIHEAIDSAPIKAGGAIS